MKKLNFIFPIIALIICGYMISKKASTPQLNERDQAIYDFSNLPVVYNGRVKPYSTLAKNAYRIISERDTFKDLDGKKSTSMHWFMDLLTGDKALYKHKIFRIDNLEVLDQLGLEKRKRYRYAYEEFDTKLEELYKLAGEVAGKDRAQRTAFENKVLSVVTKVDLFWVLAQTHRMVPVNQTNFEQVSAQLESLKEYQMPLSIPAIDYRQEWQSLAHGLFNDMTGKRKNDLTRHMALMILSFREKNYIGFNQDLEKYRKAFKEIKTNNIKALKAARAALEKEEADAKAAIDGSVEKREALMTVKAKVNAEGKKLETQEQVWLESIDRLEYETSFNRFEPFFQAWLLCIFVFTATIFSWIFLRKPLNNFALATNIIAFLVFSYGVWARYFISGYPPITNLFSTAIFIGWTALFVGIIIEFITGYGLGNLVSSVIGIITLIIAYFLGGDGDTLEMMRAVLDTKFWLLIHVTVINFGYMANYVAGIVATVYMFHFMGQKPKSLLWLALLCTRLILFITLVTNIYFGLKHFNETTNILKLIGQVSILILLSISFYKFNLIRRFKNELKGIVLSESRRYMQIIYGIICFALLFSFIGTVLGGLWADYSWGRFWGWDPKENGALIIVLWNALILHARWCGWFRNRGLAISALVGNIVTTWSWFGVNQLGVGLHSYGFTDSAAMWIMIYCTSQLLLIALACFISNKKPKSPNAPSKQEDLKA